jgi:hypothetical protein
VHFCFRCGTKLRPEAPYKHFELAGSCYGKLFDHDPATWVRALSECLHIADWQVRVAGTDGGRSAEVCARVTVTGDDIGCVIVPGA